MSELHLQTEMPQEPALTAVDDVKKVQFWRATPPQPIWTEKVKLKKLFLVKFLVLRTSKIHKCHMWFRQPFKNFISKFLLFWKNRHFPEKFFSVFQNKINKLNLNDGTNTKLLTKSRIQKKEIDQFLIKYRHRLLLCIFYVLSIMFLNVQWWRKNKKSFENKKEIKRSNETIHTNAANAKSVGASSRSRSSISCAFRT